MTAMSLSERRAGAAPRLNGEAARRWFALGLAGFALAPWHWLDFSNGYDALASYPFGKAGTALTLLSAEPWLLAPAASLAIAAYALLPAAGDRSRRGALLALAGALGLAATFAQGFAIGHKGWSWSWLGALFGGAPTQAGFGAGAAMTLTAFLLLLCQGLAWRGWSRGDSFVVSSVGVVLALIVLFILYPVGKVLAGAFFDDGAFAPLAFLAKMTDRSIWGVDCLTSNVSCGVALNSIVLGVLVGVASTALGLAFALVGIRTQARFKGALKIFALLPIITPPFVIGLALILIFGRSGLVSSLLSSWFGIPRSRWIYGLPGVALAQTLAFAPIAYMIIAGVLQGVSPSLEEASQTLRASRWRTFRTVTLPLLRPGLANAFLVGFVESLADFGNPLVLGGNFEVLSTKTFFAVVGAAVDESRAAVLSVVLLALTLAAFFAQQAWTGRKDYTTVGGKGDAGMSVPLPEGVARMSYVVTLVWTALTVAIYAMILIGGFVKTLGLDYTPTLDHLVTAFRIERGADSFAFTGSAWDSFFATVQVAAIAAPLTAAIGLLTGYLLSRQNFRGKRLFEFLTLLSFAIPGTVIGVSYILAFNTPPIEITGTALILVICFVFRNMPVGVRASMATLSQIDKSLDEASLTLGAGSFVTVKRVIAPLLRPAIVTALVYSFVRAMTAVSAVIFLVSAKYNMATTYIVGRVEAGEFGLAIAYSAALIVFMAAIIMAIQFVVGERRLGRRDGATR